MLSEVPKAMALSFKLLLEKKISKLESLNGTKHIFEYNKKTQY